MNIQHTILGFLSFEPLTGYDIKRVLQASIVTHWSGNNNQIYKVLSQLLAEGLVTMEVMHQDALPSKKLYSLSDLGRKKLNALNRTFPDIPELRKPFLLQLAFGQSLSRKELEQLLLQYEEEIQGQLLKVEDQTFPQARNSFDLAVRKVTIHNFQQFYQNELSWIEQVREKVLPLVSKKSSFSQETTSTKIEGKLVSKSGKKYTMITQGIIQCEQDGIALISLCAEHSTNLVLFPSTSLSDTFWDLSSRVAGLVLQKLANYQVRGVAVYDIHQASGVLRDFLVESNRGTSFHVYTSQEEAESWLLK